jgi:hypothetical protein
MFIGQKLRGISVMLSGVESDQVGVGEMEQEAIGPFVVRLSRRYPRGATVYVAGPSRSIPPTSVGITDRADSMRMFIRVDLCVSRCPNNRSER